MFQTKHFIRYPVVVNGLFMLAISSCASFGLRHDTRPEGRIVERSKQSRPVWADSPVNQLVVNATESKFHFSKLKQRDLPIAIKTSQSEAIESTYIPWRSNFDLRMKEFPRLTAAGSGNAAPEYETLVEQVARTIHSQAAQVEDIYYERVRIDDASKVPELTGVSEYFDVHILVQLHQVDSDKLKNAIFQTFSGARAPALKKAAKEFAPISESKAKKK